MELFTEKEYQDAKQKDKLKMKCDNCGKVFFRGKKSIIVHRTKTKLHGCSNACRGILSKQSLGLSLKMKVICKNCGKVFKKMPSQIKRSKNNLINFFAKKTSSFIKNLTLNFLQIFFIFFAIINFFFKFFIC